MKVLNVSGTYSLMAPRVNFRSVYARPASHMPLLVLAPATSAMLWKLAEALGLILSTYPAI
jgi:hypothetical protein